VRADGHRAGISGSLMTSAKKNWNSDRKLDVHEGQGGGCTWARRWAGQLFH
jgi:hypothetical protein